MQILPGDEGAEGISDCKRFSRGVSIGEGQGLTRGDQALRVVQDAAADKREVVIGRIVPSVLLTRFALTKTEFAWMP